MYVARTALSILKVVRKFLLLGKESPNRSLVLFRVRSLEYSYQCNYFTKAKPTVVTLQVLNSLKDSTLPIQRTTRVMRINSPSILNQLFFRLPSQREPSWISKKSKNAFSLLMFLRLNAPNVYLI